MATLDMVGKATRSSRRFGGIAVMAMILFGRGSGATAIVRLEHGPRRLQGDGRGCRGVGHETTQSARRRREYQANGSRIGSGWRLNRGHLDRRRLVASAAIHPIRSPAGSLCSGHHGHGVTWAWPGEATGTIIVMVVGSDYHYPKKLPTKTTDNRQSCVVGGHGAPAGGLEGVVQLRASQQPPRRPRTRVGGMRHAGEV